MTDPRELIAEARDFAERMTIEPWACNLVEKLADYIEQTLATVPDKKDKRPDWATVNATYEKWKSRAERAEALIAEKNKALKPFAALLDIFDQESANRPRNGTIASWEDHRTGERELTVEMLRAARRALNAGGGA